VVRDSHFEIGLCKNIHSRLVMPDAINHGGYTPSEDANGDQKLGDANAGIDR